MNGLRGSRSYSLTGFVNGSPDVRSCRMASGRADERMLDNEPAVFTARRRLFLLDAAPCSPGTPPVAVQLSTVIACPSNGHVDVRREPSS